MKKTWIVDLEYSIWKETSFLSGSMRMRVRSLTEKSARKRCLAAALKRLNEQHPVTKSLDVKIANIE